MQWYRFEQCLENWDGPATATRRGAGAESIGWWWSVGCSILSAIAFLMHWPSPLAEPAGHVRPSGTGSVSWPVACFAAGASCIPADAIWSVSLIRVGLWWLPVCEQQLPIICLVARTVFFEGELSLPFDEEKATNCSLSQVFIHVMRSPETGSRSKKSDIHTY
jgi:hypothetical protein